MCRSVRRPGRWHADPPGLAATTEEDIAGTVSRVQGSAIAMQDAVPGILESDSPVYIGDVLLMGPDSRLEIKMIDDGIFQVGLWSGAVVVENRGGEVEINQPDFGTRVADQKTPPVEPRPWSATKIQRAQALTSF